MGCPDDMINKTPANQSDFLMQVFSSKLESNQNQNQISEHFITIQGDVNDRDDY